MGRSLLQSVKSMLGAATVFTLAFLPFFIVFGGMYLVFRVAQSWSGLPTYVSAELHT